MKIVAKTRFDARIPAKQKDFFEYAAFVGGFRTLTEFIVFSVQQQANSIVEKHNSILASEQDKKIFFDAIMNPQKPNDKLKNAALRFNKKIANK